MIEVMVACLVLSAGLVALSAVQSQAMVNFSKISVHAGLTQTLHSINEARLLSPNEYENFDPTTLQPCNPTNSVFTKDAEVYFFQSEFTKQFAGVCSNNFTLSENQASADRFRCFVPWTLSRNIYCSSPTFGTIDLRNPVWMP